MVEPPVGATDTIRVGGFLTSEGEGVLTISVHPACCDWNNDGAATSQDYFDFVAAFFLGTADYKGDGW